MLTPQTNATLEQIAESLLERDDFVICGHVSPDGDCLGSQLALAAALRSLGKRATCVLAKPEPPDSRMAFLPGLSDMVYARDFAGEVGAFVAVDVPNRERLIDAAVLLDAAPFSVTIDHHAAPLAMTDLAYVDAGAASTTLLVWRLVELLGAERSGDVALCAYTGLVTDTGRFQFQNTDARAFSAAAEMLAAGVDAAAVSRALYQNRSLASVKLEGIAVKRMKLFAGGAGALSYVLQKDFAATGGVKADAEPLIDVLRSISGVRVACMLRDQGSSVRGSLRAKDDTDVAAIAARFGGGGHTAAAGFTVDGPIEGAAARVQRAIEEALAQENLRKDV